MDSLFQQYFDQLPGFVTVQDREFKIIAANQQFKNRYNRCVGLHCYVVYKGREEKCPVCPVEKSFQDGKRHRSEEIIKNSWGKEVTVVVSTSPIMNEKGEVVSVIEISTDISQVKHLQDQYHTLFNEVPCYISVQDKNLKIIEENRLFREAFGASIGEHCYKAYKHRDKPCTNCLVQETFKDGKKHNAEEVVTSAAGERVNVLCYTSPIINSAGDIVSVMEMQTDITEIRQLQSKLSSIGLIVGSTAHDIKGLLGGLRGGNYLIESGIQKENIPRIKQGWEMVQRNLHRVRNMVLNLLYYSKDREIKWESIDICSIVTDVYDILHSRAKEMNITFELDIDKKIGNCDGEINAIHSMLMNIVENGIHACWTDKSKDSHILYVSVFEDKEMICFTVQDNGIGMDRETQEKAFSMFFSSKGSAGTGLGLFVAHKVATNHHGSIAIESEFEKGTCFVIKIPRNAPYNKSITA